MAVGVGGAAAERARCRGVTTVVQNGSPFTFFKSRPIEIAEDEALDSGSLAAAVLRRVALVDLPRSPSARSPARARISVHRR